MKLDDKELAVIEYISTHQGEDIIKIASGMKYDLRDVRGALNTLEDNHFVSSGMRRFEFGFERVYETTEEALRSAREKKVIL